MATFNTFADFAASNPTAAADLRRTWDSNADVRNGFGGDYNKLLSAAPNESMSKILQSASNYYEDPTKETWGAIDPVARPAISDLTPKKLTPAPVAAAAAPVQATAAQWAPAGKQLVQNQLPDLLSQHNPLEQMAETQGLEAANRRGMLNSSLGAEAGALAHYQYAMPIAQADASTEANAARTNAENQTQVNLSNAQLGTQVSLANANNANDMTRLAYTADRQEQLQDKQIQANHDQLVTQLDQGTRQTYLTTLNAAQQQFQNFVNQIQVADMPEEAKTAQIQQAQFSFNSTVSFLQAAYGNMPNWQQEWALAPAVIG